MTILVFNSVSSFCGVGVAGDNHVIQNGNVTMHANNVASKASGKDAGIADRFCTSGGMVNSYLSFCPLLSLSFFLINHLWPIQSVDIISENIFDKLQLFDS